jgi:hypothetical protein
MNSPKRFDPIGFFTRFGCGFIFGGLAIGFGFLNSFVPAFLIGGLICGLLAWRFGDRFWEFFARWM